MGTEFYNRSVKSWLEENRVEMYSTHNVGKSVVDERLIRTLKNEIYKCMTSISKNICIDELDDIVNEHNNTFHRPVRIKPTEAKTGTLLTLV